MQNININTIVYVILILSALNWGLVAYNNTDLVNTLITEPSYQKYAKLAIGAAGAYSAVMFAQRLAK